MPDSEAIRRLKNGDIGGLEVLVARYQVKAIRAAYFIMQDEAEAEDVVQDVFLHIYRQIASFDERRPFEPYLMRSVVNRALNALRRRSHEAPLNDTGGTQRLEYLLDQALSVEDQVQLRELKEIILAAISALPPRQRAAITQRYYLEMSEAEMAALSEIAPGTVKWLLNAARTRLRSLLDTRRKAR